MATILYGKPVATALSIHMVEQITHLGERGILPTLAVVRLGERPDDLAYEQSLRRQCDKFGIGMETIALPAAAVQEELLFAIERLNHNASIHGILLMRPFPRQIDGDAVKAAIDHRKDLDGITDGSMAGVYVGDQKGFAPCTAQACVELLRHYAIPIAGKEICILGRSNVVGKPLAMLLLAADATVTVCHTKTKDVPARCREADIVIVATGHRGVVNRETVCPGQVILDVGIHRGADGKLCGDVLFEEVEPIVGAITPVPGGIGAVTSLMLLQHTVEAALRCPQNQQRR